MLTERTVWSEYYHLHSVPAPLSMSNKRMGGLDSTLPHDVFEEIFENEER